LRPSGTEFTASQVREAFVTVFPWRFLHDDFSATAIECTSIAGGIALVIVSEVSMLGAAVQSKFVVVQIAFR
jgi:Flp pilus assembly pilin Flp